MCSEQVYHLLALALRATYFKENPDMHEVFKQGNCPVQEVVKLDKKNEKKCYGSVTEVLLPELVDMLPH